jgi:hypothetical protein
MREPCSFDEVAHQRDVGGRKVQRDPEARANIRRP